VGVVVAAAGESRRMRGVDKTFTPVLDRPLIAHTMETLDRIDQVDAIVIVCHADSLDAMRSLVDRSGWRKVTAVVPGGARRQDSVLAGLDALGPREWVMVHDGARPCFDHEMVARGMDAALETGAAVAAVPSKDTIKSAGPDLLVTATLPRQQLWLVQTPQVFRYDILRSAYESADEDVTDDASLVERSGHRVKLFMGSYENIKVTTPEDLAVVELFLRRTAGA
jgi:2-C-methyl-D-erythritol 4-phosphate cytidylyltransferase